MNHQSNNQQCVRSSTSIVDRTPVIETAFYLFLFSSFHQHNHNEEFFLQSKIRFCRSHYVSIRVDSTRHDTIPFILQTTKESKSTVPPAINYGTVLHARDEVYSQLLFRFAFLPSIRDHKIHLCKNKTIGLPTNKHINHKDLFLYSLRVKSSQFKFFIQTINNFHSSASP